MELNKNVVEKEFSCQRDGLRISGIQYSSTKNQMPIAIVSHGFGGDINNTKEYTKFLANQGYAAFCFDFNGGSVGVNRSEGKSQDMSVLTEVEDLEAVIEYACTLENTNENHILLMGCSQGGLVSALVAAKNKYPVQDLLLMYPAFCIPDDARKGHMQNAIFDPNNVPDILYNGPMKLGKRYVTDVLEMDVFEEIKTYLNSVIILHGTQDPIVDVNYAIQANEAYLSSKDDRSHLHLLEGATHGFKNEYFEQAISILEKYLSQK